MMRACLASTSGGWVCDIIRKPTVSRPSSRARPKCWMETSASVQWVAMRQMEAPLSWETLMSSAILACLAVCAAMVTSSCSGVLENP
ncbi:Uncharacterised protein [Mycobacteroides abscessus subsp. abscessus]|nr:Uncharacterised protein [Mycobacteroides abscessus subsp. abscessus]